MRSILGGIVAGLLHGVYTQRLLRSSLSRLPADLCFVSGSMILLGLEFPITGATGAEFEDLHRVNKAYLFSLDRDVISSHYSSPL
ncbi:hypothetical protein Pelo_11019 [Pelomyxa schiedti]|nr:hypothetical protein Pelo_11019 [Pelomyxa schiedti]